MILLCSWSCRAFLRCKPAHPLSRVGLRRPSRRTCLSLWDWFWQQISPRGSAPNLFGGIKIGMPVGLTGGNPATLRRTVTLDLGYDRMQARGGFSGELSMMLPVVRFPAPHTTEATYACIYVEPGGGFRAGGGGFGSYVSAKAMLALFSDDRLTLSAAPPSLFVEVQRRFPLTALLRGDTRL